MVIRRFVDRARLAQELIERFLPEGSLRILDVGGGTGVHAEWLAQRGHDVQLVDPVPLHVEHARTAGIRAVLGDARALTQPDDSVDVVLLLGPLYHLPEGADRSRCLLEAKRVLKGGGLLFAAAISRFAALLESLLRLDHLHEPAVRSTVDRAVGSGVFRGADTDLFTNAYFHLPRELRQELTEAGFADVTVFNLEGPGFLLPDFEQRWADPRSETRSCTRRASSSPKPEMLAASSHLLGVCRKAT